MKKPSLEEVTEKFKNVEMVKSVYNHEFEYTHPPHYGDGLENKYSIYDAHGNCLYSDLQHAYATILTYKKPIRTNKLTKLEKRVEVLEAKIKQDSVINMPIVSNLKPIHSPDQEMKWRIENQNKKSLYQSFKEAIEQNKIFLPNLSDTIKMAEELKNYSKLISYGIDFGYHPDIENLKLKRRIEELEAEKKSILAGNSVKLEKGKWYRDTKIGLLICVIEIQKHGLNAYGFDANGEWHSGTYCNSIHNGLQNCRNLVPVNESEVFEALKNEAVKRGLLEGIYIKTARGKIKELKGYYFMFCKNELATNDEKYTSLFKNGVWAEIIPSITKSEAEKQLGKKIID